MNLKSHQPLVLIVLSYALGIGLSSWLPWSASWLVVAVFAFLFSAWRMLARPKTSLLCILMAFVLLGGLRDKVAELFAFDHIHHASRYYRYQNVSIKGVVVSDIRTFQRNRGAKTSFVLNIQSIKSPWGWKNKSGKVLVNMFREENIRYGDLIHLEGKLHPPYNFSAETNFSYPTYLAQRNIHFIVSVKRDGLLDVIDHNQANPLRYFFLNIREQLRLKLERHLTPNEAGIMQAIILGDRTDIPKHIRELFVRTGTAHILAISGLHVGVVAGLFFMFMKLLPLGRKKQIVFTIILLVSYACLTGGRPSIVRATIMAVVFLLGLILEKESDLLNTLSFAALIILLINPLSLYDIGFQLSFSCVISIIVLTNFFQPFYTWIFGASKSKWKKAFIDSISVSTSIWFGIVGMIAYYFHIITPITIIANLFVVPLIGVIVALGFGVLASSFIFPWAVISFSTCLKLALNSMVAMIFLFDQIPLAYINLDHVSNWYLIIYYMLLISMILWLRLKPSPSKKVA